jgi:hypothetical protein
MSIEIGSAQAMLAAATIARLTCSKASGRCHSR